MKYGLSTSPWLKNNATLAPSWRTANKPRLIENATQIEEEVELKADGATTEERAKAVVAEMIAKGLAAR